MRILYASDTVLPSRAANTVQSLRTVEALQRLGHTVTFVNRTLEARPTEIAEQYGLGQGLHLVAARHLRWRRWRSPVDRMWS